MSIRESVEKGTLSHWLDMTAVFIVALLPRVANLAAIVTPDERRWVERSVGFMSALLSGDWAGTFQTGHPGVTTMWTGSFGLWIQYLVSGARGAFTDFLAATPARPSAPPGVLAAVRLPTAVLTALVVLLAYVLLRRLHGRGPALFAGVLLALDPFYLAHSRVIHHDALASTFVLLALLGFTGYAWKGEGRGWLVGSGVASALAMLSKGSALFLLPFVGLVWLAESWAHGAFERPLWPHLRPRLGGLLVWCAVVLVVFVALWPAMWVDPAGTVAGMFDKAVEYAQEAHSNGNYFFGRPVEDPGPLFYPVALLFRTTPLTLIGFFISVVLLVRDLRKRPVSQWFVRPEIAIPASLLAFVVLFMVFMTFGSKKFDRYLLPAFLPVDILAGLAFAAWAVRLRSSGRAGWTIVGAALLVLQALGSVPQHPFYLSVYNPLVGGPWIAQQMLLVGWGEGLEEAAEYLNALPDARNRTAATFYYRDFKTFYVGTAEKLTDDNLDNLAPWRNSDHVVFYVNQVQREIPVLATIRFFQGMTPEFSFERNGIPYVQIYLTPKEVPADVMEQEAQALRTP